MKNCISKQIKWNLNVFFAGDPQNDIFLIATQSAYNLPTGARHAQKITTEKTGVKHTFQWRPLTLLPSLDSTTFANIFFYTHQKWNH